MNRRLARRSVRLLDLIEHPAPQRTARRTPTEEFFINAATFVVFVLLAAVVLIPVVWAVVHGYRWALS